MITNKEKIYNYFKYGISLVLVFLFIQSSVPAKSVLMDSFEESLTWTIDTSADLATLSISTLHATDGKQSLFVTVQDSGKDKAMIGHDEARDLTSISGIKLDVTNPMSTPVTISIAMLMGPKWWWTESKPITLQPGLNKNIWFDFTKKEFKTDKTESLELSKQFTQPIDYITQLKRLYILVFTGQLKKVNLFIDNIRWERNNTISKVQSESVTSSVSSKKLSDKHQTTAATVRTPHEMLVNGSFANGSANWVVEQAMGATGLAEYVKEGPDGKTAMRLKVLSIASTPWRLQVYQKGLRVEKDKPYLLTFWVKSDRTGDITVNCMQNHEPWDHHMQEIIPVSTNWKQIQFKFVPPWNDNNMRICFTNLGTTTGRIYWFANCSLVTTQEAKMIGAVPAAVKAAPAIKQVVVWDGEQANKGAGWTNPTTATIKPQTVEAHSGKKALEFKFESNKEWVGAGWNWCAFQTGHYGTDISAMKNFTFWIKKKGIVADLQINLLCNGPVFDMPEHHTEKVSVLKYCPQLLDGKWHKVSIPLADLKQPEGFDPLHVAELQMFNAGVGDGSFIFDDIAFDNRTIQ